MGSSPVAVTYLSHWSTKVPLIYLKNVVTGKFDRAKKIASDDQFEVNRIKTTFLYASFLQEVTQKIVNTFNKIDEIIIKLKLFFDKQN